MNIHLTRELEQLVQTKVKSGRYNSAIEVIHEALRLLEQRDEVDAANETVAMATLIVSIALYGVLSAKEALDELAVLNEDGSETFKGTAYATHLRAIPNKLYRTVSVLVQLAVAVVLLIALFAV